ncbi:hypothetical protein AAHK20_06545 [Trinickia sp. YCB016]
MNFEKQDNSKDASQYKAMSIAWRASCFNELGIVYEASVEQSKGRIRVNDFPDEFLYTLLIDDVEIIHFNEWPESWSKP